MPRPTYGYRLADGTRVPGVTTILAMLKGDPGALMHWAWKLGTEGKDYRAERDNACSIGHAVHALIEADILGVSPEMPEGIGADDPKVVSAYGAYRQWRAGVTIEIIATELALVSEQYKFGGTLDLLALVNGVPAILDWKTSNHIYGGEAVPQCAAYAQLVAEAFGELPEAAYLLRVGKDEGDFHLHYWGRNILDTAWSAFQHAHQCYELKKKLDKVC